jgi:hypothetical protein
MNSNAEMWKISDIQRRCADMPREIRFVMDTQSPCTLFQGVLEATINREISQPIYFASLDVGFILIIRHGI